MKNIIIFVFIATLSLFTFCSCSNENVSNEEKTVIKSSNINVSLKKEAEKLVDLHCKAINILRKVDKGDRTALNRSNAIRKEADLVSHELKRKYSSPEEQEEFSKAYQDALENCPSVPK